MRTIILSVLALALAMGIATAGLTPGDVLVVYDSTSQWSAISRAVADYYCSERGIPEVNKVGVDLSFLWSDVDYLPANLSVPYDAATPEQFVQYIQSPLEQYLTTHFGSDPDHPETDPIKAIVLCYGIPKQINSNTVNGALDPRLSLLFNSTPWGRGLPTLGGENPYYELTEQCLTRSKPADFAEFRASAQNDVESAHPPFYIVRMLDATHAVAGTADGMPWFPEYTYGALYRGFRTTDGWEWTAVPEENMGFVQHNITDIYVGDPQHAWVSTGGGTVLETSDGGAHWQIIATGLPADIVRSVSFNGQAWLTGTNSGDGSDYVMKLVGAEWQSAFGDLPPDCEPCVVTAVDQSHVWVSGTGGIWFTADGGDHWFQQHLSPSGTIVGDIAVRKVGDDYIGWAIQADGHIMHMTDGVNWSVVSGVSLPEGVESADLAMFDESHVTMAYGEGAFLVYNGSTWITETTDAANSKSSVAWSGGEFLGASGANIRLGQGSPGALTWSQSYAGQPAHIKMRYLVCRLDAYAEPTVEISPGVSIPVDIKGMIHRSVASANPGTTQDAKFIFDDGSQGTSNPSVFPDQWATCLRSLVEPNGEVIHVTGEAFLPSQDNMMGYANNGFYDSPNMDLYTTWNRPFHRWKNGAIGIIWGDSNDGRTLRAPYYLPRPVRVYNNLEAGKLKVVLHPIWSSLYSNHYIALHAADHSRLRFADDQEARAYFVYQYGGPVATLDLTNVVWPAYPHHTYLAVHFADNDPQHPYDEEHPRWHYIPKGYTPTSDAIWKALDEDTGISYDIGRGQALAAELIHEGCSGVTGNVKEPGSPYNCAIPGIAFPQYVSGSTWAESAYMALPGLATQFVAGDPLMSPYATPPSASFDQPDNQAVIAGTVLAQASAESAPDPETGIKRVELWITNQDDVYKYVGADSQSSSMCALDTSTAPDGAYKLRAVAYENNPHGQGEAAECLRDITIANTSAPTTISITQPAQNGVVLSDTVTLVAEASNPAAISSAKFQLFGPGGYRDVPASGSPLTGQVDTTVIPDGDYTLVATAIATNGTICGSPARQVTIANPGIVQITDPGADGSPVSGSIDVQIAVNAVNPPAVSHVELWISGEGVQEELVGSDSTAPYSVSLNTSSLADGAYTLRAAAYKEGGVPIANQALRRVIVLNDHVMCDRIRDARKLDNETAIAIGPKPVVAGNSAAMDGAFYIEEEDRSGGLRIAWTNSTIPAGKMVAVWGVMGSNALTGEREIIAEGVWVGGDAPEMRPIGMIGLAVGGVSPDDEPDTNGITDSHGTYNIGMLVSLWGDVVYVGDDYVYIDDGSNVYDGNGMEGAIVDKCDGNPPPEEHPLVHGIRVSCSGLDKPGIGDYVCVTGISSTISLESVSRYIRPRSQEDIVQPLSYTRCAKKFYYAIWGRFIDQQQQEIPVGSQVRMVNAQVYDHDPLDRFVVAHEDLDIIHQAIWAWTPIMYPTAWDELAYVTVVGTSGWISQYDQCIYPHRLYLGGQAYGAMGMQQGPEMFDGKAASEADPWPSSTAEEIESSDLFQEAFYSQGAIGWALAQPDGTVVSLIGEQVISQESGGIYGLKETFDTIEVGPRLYLDLGGFETKDIFPWEIDIINGTITTLANGRRAVVKPEAVYVYTDSTGQACGPIWLKMGSLEASMGPWPWTRRVYP